MLKANSGVNGGASMIGGPTLYGNSIWGMNGYGSANSATYQGMATGTNKAEGNEGAGVIKNPGESTKVAPGKKSSPAECETCKERKYQDGSDEMVSFKSAAHISPSAAGAAVRSHEQEHVSNAYKKAAQKGGEVLRASVSIHTAVCPECGRSYVSGGTTSTQIKYSNESNPYQKDKKSVDALGLRGANIDIAG